MSNHPRLRDLKKLSFQELYPLNEIPNDIIVKICSHIVYLVGVGRTDLSGDDFGDAFADAVNGTHYASPVGIADVGVEHIAWSAKTVKNKNPFDATAVRLISGRNSPDYSYGIEDPHADVQRTGDAVLGIWNERINIAFSKFKSLRTIILVRNNDLTQFTLFEEDTRQVRIADYRWEVNKNGNFIGIEKSTKKQRFTWQPHGSQFTIRTEIPLNAKKFDLKRPTPLSKNAFLVNLKYDDTWVHMLDARD